MFDPLAIVSLVFLLTLGFTSWLFYRHVRCRKGE